MDICLTGSHGLIGTALIPRLRADGHRVLRLVRGDPEGADDVRWDPDAGTIDAAGLEGVDAVVHLAGAGIGDKKWTPQRKQLVLESRTRGTGLLARTLAGLDRKPSVLVSASAIGYYGNRGDDILTEDEPPGRDFGAQVCVAWEDETKAAADAGIRVVRTRTGLVLAKQGGLLQRLLLPFKLGDRRSPRFGQAVHELDRARRRPRRDRPRPQRRVDLRSGEPHRAEPGAQQ